MPERSVLFWTTLMNVDEDEDTRRRLWNGYVGWKLPPEVTDTIKAPDGGWPNLTDDEKARLDDLAERSGGHPEYDDLAPAYIDFANHPFQTAADFSGLVLLRADFGGASFANTAHFTHAVFVEESRFDDVEFLDRADFRASAFDGVASFRNARFVGDVNMEQARFDQHSNFANAAFRGYTDFIRTLFRGAATFSEATFEIADFSGARFQGDVRFTGAQFARVVTIKESVFARAANFSSAKFENGVDLTGAEFKATTDFGNVTFRDVPIMFNTKLHDDTDFAGVRWQEAEAGYWSGNNVDRTDDAIRAWERLELIMSTLEKPHERHQFYRLKMRARRKSSTSFGRARWLMVILNWLFEKSSDYGWGSVRAFLIWFLHWFISSMILFVNASVGNPGDPSFRQYLHNLITSPSGFIDEHRDIFLHALAVGFSNAHAILGLQSADGYLEKSRTSLQAAGGYCMLSGEPATLCLLTFMGSFQAVVGPISLFLVLLTMRNRFRLA